MGIESSLTLRRLLVWTYDPKIRLKTLAALVDHCHGNTILPIAHKIKMNVKIILILHKLPVR